MPWDNPRSARLPSDWSARRKRILARDPVCRVDGCSWPSTEVHHVRGDDHSDDALVGICAPHHRKITNEQAATARWKPDNRRGRPTEKHPGLK